MAKTLNNIALTYKDQGTFDEALANFEESILGTNHLDVAQAQALNNIILICLVFMTRWETRPKERNFGKNRTRLQD